MATFQNLPAQRRLLDAIASGEANGYDIMYGGGRFGSYADHPRQAIPIQSGPNTGKTSSAAGRYQFLAPTWDQVAKEAGLKDFSPESQDAGAWYLANKTYAAKTGRDLLADMEAGRTQDIGSALSGVWTSLPGGIEPNKATAGFDARLGTQMAANEPAAQPPTAQPQQGGLLAALGTKDNALGGLLSALLQGNGTQQAAQPQQQKQTDLTPEPVQNLIPMQRTARPPLRIALPYGGLLGGLA